MQTPSNAGMAVRWRRAFGIIFNYDYKFLNSLHLLSA
jgi:hypothetical protein